MQCPGLKQLEVYVDGTLSGRERQDVDVHVRHCLDCRRRTRDIKRNRAVFDDIEAVLADEAQSESTASSDSAQAAGVAQSDTAPLTATVDQGDSPAHRPTTPKLEIEGYEILRELHRGGQGVVFLAHQLSTKRQVAIKILLEGPFATDAARRRFEREIELAARLRHPNIVAIYHSGETADGRRFCVMDYVRGQPLNHYIREHSVSLEKVLALFAAICDAVNFAHQNGVIHRDLKPSNILVDTSGVPKVLDFGLAKQLGGPEETLVSLTGQVIGTLPYMAPEQARGTSDDIDVRTDVYALGVVLYEALTGQFPYPVGGRLPEVLKHITETAPKIPRKSWEQNTGIAVRSGKRRRSRTCPIDDELETVMLKALAKERERRYQGAGELGADVQHYLAGEPIEAKRDSGWYMLKSTVRRYRVAATVAALFVVLVTSSAIALSVMYSRERELHRKDANQQADQAYARLVQIDFRAADLAALAQTLDHAERKGADLTTVALARALADVGAGNVKEAIGELQRVRTTAPDNLEAIYLLAWAYWESENDNKQEALVLIEEAERLGGPQTDVELFFHGLAVLRHDPDSAIDSYLRANDLRTRSGGLFPQAVLNLARAHNQRMYAQRTIESFDESESALRHLIQYGERGAYPYYLLAIAHRFAAEILRDEAGPDDPRVPEHFAAALEAARQGQQEEPENVDAVSAEAECLESMGEFEQAVEVRTRAMAKAHTRPAMHEALHYRWRLHYWTGSLEAALADVNRIEGDFGSSDEVSRTFAHLYPALIHAELGDSETAHRLAVAREDDDASTMDVVFAATTLRLLGSADAADDLLAQRAGLMESASEGDDQQAATWLRELYSFCSGDLPRDDLLALANRAARPRDLVAELQYHATAMALARGDRAQAMRDLEAAYRSFDGEENYTYHAKVLLWKMRADPAWPPWIQPAGDPFPSPNDNDRSTEVIESGEEPS